jgi:putative colanic acid biosysnthesis UDP-glucose lipid carrier transferase
MANRSLTAFIHRLLDSIIIVAALVALVLAYDPMALGPYYWLAGLAAALVFLAVGEITHLYASWRVYGFRQEVAELAGAVGAVVVVLVTLGFLTKTSDQFSRVIMGLWWVVSFLLLALLRLAARSYLRASRARGYNLRRLAIAGAGELGRKVAERVMRAEWLGLRLVGFYDDAVPGVRGDFEALVGAAHQGEIDYIYIALPLAQEAKVVQLINRLSDTTTSVFFVPDLFVFEMMQARWTEVEGMPVVSVFDTPFLGIDGWVKRVEDVLLASALLLLALPLMLLIAAGVKLTSPGPVLFKQRRHGLSGKVVEVWKFRTMRTMEDGEHVPQARRRDPRITAFGAFLRRSSLDELPQLFNVLTGNMSVVGPRPHALAHNEQYRALVSGYMLRHKVKPGITGWAQVNGWRGETDTLDKMRKRVECDLYYIRNWSIWMDLKIVMLTALRGFTQPNAY